MATPTEHDAIDNGQSQQTDERRHYRLYDSPGHPKRNGCRQDGDSETNNAPVDWHRQLVH